MIYFFIRVKTGLYGKKYKWKAAWKKGEGQMIFHRKF